MTKELEGHFGESIMLMSPSGFVLGLEEEEKHIDEILDL